MAKEWYGGAKKSNGKAKRSGASEWLGEVWTGVATDWKGPVKLGKSEAK